MKPEEMRYIIFDHMQECSEQEVARLLPLVSEQRREQALRYKHLMGRYCCLKSYELLQELLGDRCKPVFVYNSYGQPQLDKGPYFSISHCKAGIAVAVSDRPVGVDIEAIRQAKSGLIAKTMNAEEQAMIARAADADKMFTQLWTRKEAYLKMIGTGIINDLHGTLEQVREEQLQSLDYSEKGYMVSLAHGTID